MPATIVSRGSRNMGRRKRQAVVEAAKKRERVIPVKSRRISLQDFSKEATDNLIAANADVSVEYISGHAVPSRIVQVPIANLDVWTDNPRTYCVCEDDARTQEQEVEELLTGHKTAQLAVQLAHNGGIPEALIGVAKPGGRVDVVDGCRRTAASLVLAGIKEMPEQWPRNIKQEIADVLAHRPYPQTLPVKVFEGITRAQLQSFLAIKHASGQLSWGSLQKGQYAYSLCCEQTGMNLSCDKIGDLRRVWKELSQKDQDVLKRIAHECGTRPNRLRTYIMAYVANAYFCGQYDIKDDKNFTAFAKFYDKKWFRDMTEGIQPTLRDDKEVIDILWPDKKIEAKFMEWLASGLITDCVQVDNLHVILNDLRTKEVFEADGFKAAEAIYNAADTDNVLSVALDELETIKADLLKDEEGQDVRETLRAIHAKIAELAKEIGEPL